jgi:hypothetical protein
VSCDSSLGKDLWSIVGSRWSRKAAANALVTPPRVAQAAPAVGPELPQTTSYRDLLDPIPNALPLLKADDQRLAQSAGTRTAQVVIGDHHHHHHHRGY